MLLKFKKPGQRRSTIGDVLMLRLATLPPLNNTSEHTTGVEATTAPNKLCSLGCI